MTIRIALLTALFLVSSAWAQTEPQPSNGTPDLPFGAPYNVGAMAERERLDNAQVSLRDYLSSRIDQIGADLNGKIEQQQKIIDERDHQYAQRFDAQQEALSAALLAQKEAVANALSAAKEAVNKAEEANSKRFDGVNEFRKQLDDQANTFMTKDAADAHFKAIEDKVDILSSQLANIASNKEGANSTYALLGGAVLFLIAIGTFAMTAAKFRKEPR